MNSFDLTYEELKHFFVAAADQMIGVLILPMRNWNPYHWSQNDWDRVLIWPLRNWNIRCLPATIRPFGFWSYLWGIETTEVPGIYQAEFVLILPMRNWNSWILISIRHKSFMVLILPMRNWNAASWKRFGQLFKFWSYLWGIETGKRRHCRPGKPGFWSYLWGIETSVH